MATTTATELTTTVNPDAENYATEWATRGFGAVVPEQAKEWWTARTIWRGYSSRFEFLSDRRAQSSYPLPDGFGDFIQEAIETLGKKFENMSQKDGDRVYVENEKYVIYGSPNSSYGYAYLSAWRKK